MLVRFLVSQFQPSNVSGWHTYSLRDELFIYFYAGSCGVVSHNIQQEKEEEEVTEEEGAKVIFSSSSLIVIRLIGYCDWGSKRRGVGFDKVRNPWLEFATRIINLSLIHLHFLNRNVTFSSANAFW